MADKEAHAVALVYAEALFELVLETNQTQAQCEELGKVASLVQTVPDFALFLESPAISDDQKKNSISRIFEGKISDLLFDFLMVVARKGRLQYLLDIEDCFTMLENQRAGRVQAVLKTAIELSGKDQVRLRDQIGRALGKTVELESQVDPDIIGGMVLTVDDTIIDGSVKRSLELFEQQCRRAGAGRFDAAEFITN